MGKRSSMEKGAGPGVKKIKEQQCSSEKKLRYMYKIDKFNLGGNDKLHYNHKNF